MFALPDSFSCNAVKFNSFLFACLKILVENSKSWRVNYGSLVNFKEFTDKSIYVSGAFKYSGSDDVEILVSSDFLHARFFQYFIRMPL